MIRLLIPLISFGLFLVLASYSCGRYCTDQYRAAHPAETPAYDTKGLGYLIQHGHVPYPRMTEEEKAKAIIYLFGEQ